MIFFKKLSIIIIFLSLFSISYNTNTEKFKFPTEYTTISSKYGNRNIFGSNNFHNGIDFLAPQNSKVYACSSGVIIEITFSTSYGNYILIEHSNGYRSLYGHLSEEKIVNIGDYITRADYIGNVGPKYLSDGKLNGITTGPHLHFTVFNENGDTIDPYNILE